MDKWLVIIALLMMAPAAIAAQVEAHLPEAIDNDESALLEAAQAVEAVELDGGYRQYDLVVARVSMWEGERNLTVRLFLPPAEHDEPYPLVGYVHGGHFISGSPEVNLLSQRRDITAAKRALLDEGVAVASLGYRLAREAGWPAPISDTLCGLRFLVMHGAEWGVDAGRIGISGHSAGARIAGLLGMVPQDAFHVQQLPWQEVEVNIAAVWLWAGAVWDWPQVDRWTEYGKPRNYSVPRLLFGEHPSQDDTTRHRLRLRYNLPHLSRAMPPLYMLRGERDYGGDHTDAERVVEVWEALGLEVHLSIVPGGHSAAGPTEPVVAFFKEHLTGPAPESAAPERLETARRLLSVDEPAAALEVLNARHTRGGGRELPAGEWLILHDDTVLWLADVSGWPDEDREVAREAHRMLAAQQAEAAERLLERREWFRAREAAQGVLTLAREDEAMRTVAEQAQEAAEREAALFRTLAEANALCHDGRREAAVAALTESGDDRLRHAGDRIDREGEFDTPRWAVAAGVDVYGRWADLALNDDVTMRFRWVEPGEWDLPEHLRFRNRADEPWVDRIEVGQGFWLADTPTTVAQWRALSGDHPSSAPEGGADAAKDGEGQEPKAGVDYLAIVDWLEELSEQHPGTRPRLPTEQQWLHAATLGGRDDVRAGLDLHAVHALHGAAGVGGDASNRRGPGPRAVDDVLPDLGGFYGLIGGVHEWTASPGRHVARFTDDTGRFRVLAYPIARGGAWSSMPHSLGLDTREQHRHGNRQPDLGFRVALAGEGEDEDDWLSEVEQ